MYFFIEAKSKITKDTLHTNSQSLIR